MKKVVFILLTFFTVIFSQCAVAQKGNGTLKVLSYNSMHGFTTDSTSLKKYVGWVNTLAPDVVMYQEMIGYTKASVKALAAQYGHSYFEIISPETGYDVTHPLAITSKFPLAELEMKNEGMWHSYLHAKIKGIHFMVTHLAPFTLKDRHQDVDVILTKVKSLPKNAKVIVAGDFNSFARFDSGQYTYELQQSMLRLEGRLEPKSGTPIVKNRTIYRNNLDNGKLDYTVTDKMLGAGLVDAYYTLNKSFKNSVPVKSKFTKKSFLRRTDYMWVNEVLVKVLKKADIVHDEVTDVISDHYPLVAEFALN